MIQYSNKFSDFFRAETDGVQSSERDDDHGKLPKLRIIISFVSYHKIVSVNIKHLSVASQSTARYYDFIECQVKLVKLVASQQFIRLNESGYLTITVST